MARRKKERLLRQQPDHRANRTILIRTLILMGIFGVAVFVPLFLQLWKIQIEDYDYYRGLVADQQTKDSTVEANRGTIYDSNGVPLALSATVYNVQLSPKEIIQCQENYKEKVEQAEKNGKDPPDYPEPTNEFIAENLAEILDLEVDSILARLAKENSLYEMIKWRVEPEESEAVEQFITENHISGIYLMPTSKRYYPKGSLASQVIGWVNPNLGEGAYGVEALYEEELAGETGRVVTAKNGVGTEMLYWFEDYYDATNGDDLTLTIDATIQSFCESILKKGVEQFDVQNGGFCIAMAPNTGEILAWANSPTYDLNDPWAVTDPVLSQYLESVKNDPSTNAADPVAQQGHQRHLRAGLHLQVHRPGRRPGGGRGQRKRPLLLLRQRDGGGLVQAHQLLLYAGPQGPDSGPGGGQLLQPGLCGHRPAAGGGEVLRLPGGLRLPGAHRHRHAGRNRHQLPDLAPG